MKKSELMEENRKVLFLGNGINRAFLDNKYSWGSLIKELFDKNGIKTDIDFESNLPYTLIFEHLVSEMVKNSEKRQIKKAFSKISNQIVDNFSKKENLGKLIPKLKDFDVIITTNFDKNLQFGNSWRKTNNFINKVTYSTFRSYEKCLNAKMKTIHYIHGFIETPSSLCLGLKHYANELAKNEEYFYRGLKGKESLQSRLRSNNFDLKEHYSWIDYFFDKNISIDIVGFGLSFEESDIWWVLEKRLEFINTNPILQSNKVTYYYNKNEEDELNSKLSILRAFKIETNPIELVSFNMHKEFINSYFNKSTEA